MIVPDYVSPLIGHRAWQWNGSCLKSLNGGCWYPNQPLAARCRARNARVGYRHQAPQDGCTCGIYALKTPELAMWGSEIDGEVYLWGTVVEHEFGWRAQYAYPKRLVVSPPITDPMPLVGSHMLRNPKYRLATLTKYGADIYLAEETGEIPVWLARSGYHTEGLKRCLEVIRCFQILERHRNREFLKLAARHVVEKVGERGKRPPGPPPPPPAVPVHSPADIIRIIQSGRHGWPAHWALAADCETREVCDG